MKGNYNQDNEILDLDDLDELDILDEGESNSLPPLRLELDGITTEEELTFIKSKANSDALNQVPFYISFGLETVYVCDVDLDIDLLLNLKFIGLNKYTLTLVNGDRKLDILKPDIDEGSIEMLLNFVRIGGLD